MFEPELPEIWEISEKIFLPYLSTSIRARPFQLYDEFGEILFAKPEVQLSNLYFIVEYTKIRFIPEKVTLSKDGTIEIFFRIANKRLLRQKTTLPKLFLDHATLKGFKSAIIGVKNQENFQKELIRRKTSFLTGISFNRAKSNDNVLIFDLYTQSWARELPMIAHNVMDLLKVSVGGTPKILYIGQSNQIKQRTTAHKKIQKALSETPDNKDVYIYFFTFAPQEYLWNKPDELASFLNDVETKPIDDQGQLNLVEMGLINYFKPKYNTTFTNSAIPSNQQVEKLLKANGFTQMTIEINFDSELWHFGSDYISSKPNHTVTYKLDSNTSSRNKVSAS